MKPIFYFFIFLLSSLVVTAAYGGENTTIHIDKCRILNVTVNGSLKIDNDEFSFYNCNKINQTFWTCNCTDNYDLIMNIGLTTVNNYTLTLDYSYEQIEESGGGGSGGGGRISCTNSWTCSEWSSCTDGKQVRSCIDSNNCALKRNQPAEEQSCEVTKETIQEIAEQKTENVNVEQKTETQSNAGRGITGRVIDTINQTARKPVFIVPLIIVIIICILLIARKLRRRKHQIILFLPIL